MIDLGDGLKRIETALKKELPIFARDMLALYGDRISETGFVSAGRVVAPSHRAGIEGKLQMSSGALARSLMANVKGDHTKPQVTVSGGKISASLQSLVPYAAIQYRGGAIPPTAKMVRFFWAMWYKSNDTFWKAMALHAKMGKPIVIKPKRYTDEGTKQFKADLPKQATAFLIKIFKENT